MTIQDDIASLRRKIDAAIEEFDEAFVFHEAWKPAAYSDDVHKRMGNSRATHVFHAIRVALRREMVMALMRIWDTDEKAIKIKSISNSLQDKRVVEFLAKECETDYLNRPHIQHFEDNLSDSDREYLIADSKKRRCNNAKMAGEKLRALAAKCVTCIGQYLPDGCEERILRDLRSHRHERLAHRQIQATKDYWADISADEIEKFYQMTSELIRDLRLVVHNVGSDHDRTAREYGRRAELFWNGVRGEKTPGHPDYKPPPRPLE